MGGRVNSSSTLLDGEHSLSEKLDITGSSDKKGCAHARAYKRQKHGRTDARRCNQRKEKPPRGRIAQWQDDTFPGPPHTMTHTDTHTERRSRQAAPRKRNPTAMQEAQTSAAHRQSPLTFAKLHMYYATRVRTPAVSGQRSGGPPNSLESPLSLYRSTNIPPPPPSNPHLGSAGAASSAIHSPLPIFDF
ncbi:hypothetical protein ISCGN_000823 [Ixodes scapularis]